VLVPSSAVRRFACAVAVLAVTVTVAGCSGSGVPGLDGAAEAVGTTSPVETLQSQLDTLASTYEMDPDTDVSIAALDTVTGQSMQYGSSSGMVAASAVKAEILVATLLDHQDAGTSLSDADDLRATQMIESSDNDAATALFDEVGGTAAMNAASVRLHMGHTSIGDDGYFGFTVTNAQDQITLLKSLVHPASPLDSNGRAYAMGLMRNVDTDESWGVTAASDTGSNPASPLDSNGRAYAMGLMRNVDTDESWGVTAASDTGSNPAVKNGWLPVDSDEGRWAVTSIGVITAGGHETLLAVFTQHQDEEQYGIDFIERASKLVVAGLATTPPR